MFILFQVLYSYRLSRGFLGGSLVKNPPAMRRLAIDVGPIPGSGRSSGGGNGNPFQYSCLGNPMDRGAWLTTVHRVTKESDMTKEQQHKLSQTTEESSLFCKSTLIGCLLLLLLSRFSRVRLCATP